MLNRGSDNMSNDGLNLQRLLLYRQILEDATIRKAQELVLMMDTPGQKLRSVEKCYYDMLQSLIKAAERNQWNGDLWKNYVLELVLNDENIFSLACERSGEKISAGLYQSALNDIAVLKELFNFNLLEIADELGMNTSVFSLNFQNVGLEDNLRSQYIFKCNQFHQLKELFTQDESPQALLSALAEFYHVAGCGTMRKFHAFSWNKGLQGIGNHDPVMLDDLVGYEYQKKILLGNTEALISGKKANNILLYGERGTGKSSSVKALLNQFGDRGLRMIELSKRQLLELPDIIKTVSKRGLYFIIFIDDLSFEEFEIDYKEIKAGIDGSLQASPDNMILYVTSNRRHLIKENWSDRKPSGEEVHISDTYQEKLSFADRFGIMISYQSPKQEEYLQIINELARRNKVAMPPKELEKYALQWERKYHGRSGRTAQQFITHIMASNRPNACGTLNRTQVPLRDGGL